MHLKSCTTWECDFKPLLLTPTHTHTVLRPFVRVSRYQQKHSPIHSDTSLLVNNAHTNLHNIRHEISQCIDHSVYRYHTFFTASKRCFTSCALKVLFQSYLQYYSFDKFTLIFLHSASTTTTIATRFQRNPASCDPFPVVPEENLGRLVEQGFYGSDVLPVTQTSMSRH